MEQESSETALSIFIRELFCEIIFVQILFYVFFIIFILSSTILSMIESLLITETTLNIIVNNSLQNIQKEFSSLLNYHEIRFISFSLLMTVIVRLPWQMIISFYLRYKHRHSNKGIFRQTITPIISSYLICYTIFILSLQSDGLLKGDMIVIFEIWLGLLAVIGLPSLSAALLTPYIRYRITGKRLKDYFPSTESK